MNKYSPELAALISITVKTKDGQTVEIDVNNLKSFSTKSYFYYKSDDGDLVIPLVEKARVRKTHKEFEEEFNDDIDVGKTISVLLIRNDNEGGYYRNIDNNKKYHYNWLDFI